MPVTIERMTVDTDTAETSNCEFVIQVFRGNNEPILIPINFKLHHPVIDDQFPQIAEYAVRELKAILRFIGEEIRRQHD